MDKVVNKTLKLGYYYYSLVKICGILWLAKQIQKVYFVRENAYLIWLISKFGYALSNHSFVRYCGGIAE